MINEIAELKAEIKRLNNKYDYQFLVKNNADLTASLKSAVDALDTACGLLPVAEHRQDDEWYSQEKEVNQTLKKLKAKHPDLFEVK